jgi:hypothetical protein
MGRLARAAALSGVALVFASSAPLHGCSADSGANAAASGDDGGGSTGDSGSAAQDGTTTTPSDASGMDSSPGSIDAGLDPTPRCSMPAPHGDLTSPPQGAPPAAAGVSFLTDWGADPASGGWKRTQIIDGCRYHAEGTTWHGKAAARVEVDPGDDPLSLGADSERAEMLAMQDGQGNDLVDTTASGDVYYATSYFFPSSWDGTFLNGDSNSWSFVMQLYPWGGLAAGRRGPGQPQTLFFTAGGVELGFASGGSLALGKWTDLVLLVSWGSAHVTLWRREEGATAFAKEIDGAGGATNTASFYAKQGLYRGGNVSGRTDVLWIGPTARGATFSAVEQAAFGTSAGIP